MSTSISAVQNTNSIKDAEFVELTVSFTNGTASINRTFYFSTSYKKETIGGNLYGELGPLLGITTTQRDISSTGYDTAISITGMDPYWIYVVAGSPATTAIPVTGQADIPIGYYPLIKGSKLTIRRGFYDDTYTLTSTVLRYTGIITSYSINEERDSGYDAINDTYTISLQCSNYKQVLENRISGRKTNSTSWKQKYPNDTSMDRVSGLEGKQFDFGKAVTGKTTTTNTPTDNQYSNATEQP